MCRPLMGEPVNRQRPDDICPQMDRLPPLNTVPAAMPIYPASVYACGTPDEVDQMLASPGGGYVYQREAHPNGDVFAEKCRQLHHADQAIATASGMAALAAALLSQVQQGQRVLISNRLYGRSTVLFHGEAQRLGIECSEVDTSDLAAVEQALQLHGPRLFIVETISNPMLRVASIARLAELCIERELCCWSTIPSPLPCSAGHWTWGPIWSWKASAK